ncbi:NAD(P)/FAD-dependent oxidoreductase [Hydrogenophaga borbori]|uniref:NAD(P)/FAD-dependent oxidoreductase n=1 Tax=Hydrogenophaga borbori TaxID=2294117 RepID=A0A372EKB8_9BURK|nr:NAD(P)/FAD-dependent oxidoreductase [Hydrogenophaga borbori]RFP79364.1 NAD(P)/FAD-dependent oxidoreductase [Hydrogenophaga borbori]
MNIEPFDAAIVGGSYAGLSAGLQLARARRRLLVIDAGQRRNRFAASSHGFLGQDGRPPQHIAADAQAQLRAYPTVRWLDASVTEATRTEGGFELRTHQGDAFSATRLVLATGVVDQLPPIEGLAERWGRAVFHCPYCHGYELQQGRIGVLARSELSMHHALMLPDWGQVTLFLDEAFSPSEQQLRELDARGVAIERARVRRVVEHATVELEDGRRLPMDGLFTLSWTRSATPLAEQLGCAIDQGPMGEFVRTDAMKATTVPGVFACGDLARAAGNVALAVGDGALAGAAAHRSLLFPSG